MLFLTRPVFDIRPDWSSIEHGQFDDFSLMEVAPGAGTPWKSTGALKRRLTLPFLFFTKSEWREFRDFVEARKGMQDGFWLPLWITDYDSFQQTQGTTDLKIHGVNLAGVFTADEQFAFVALIDATQFEPNEIVSIADLGGGDEQLNLGTAIAGSFTAASCICCGMIYARLASDTLRYQYLTDGVIRCDVDFVELPKEYVTPIVASTPVFLYEFTRGELVWRMSNWPEPLVVDEECWSPDNIKHGSLRSGIDFLPEDLTLNVATESDDHPLRYYLTRSAFEVTEIQIWETNAETWDFDREVPLYKGRVGNVEFRDRGEIQAQCSSLLRLAEQQLPRMQAQRTCNHRLYDVNCGVDADDFEISGTITALTDAYVQATAFATEASAQSDAQWFALGRVRVGVETRMVVGQDTAKLYINEPFKLAQVGDTATAWPGCNKRVSHCVGRYDNILRAAMFSYIPNGNPQFEALLNPKPAGGKKA